MSIPANDAFTLNAHSHSPLSQRHTRGSSMPSTRRLTRSPSPKTVFRAAIQSPESSKPTRRRPIRRLSSGSSGFLSDSNGLPDAVALGVVHEQADIAPTPSVTHNPSAADKIDWEVPRKVFHSSIGFVVLPLYSSHFSVRVVIVYLSVALVVVYIADVIRLRYQTFARTYEAYLGFLMRESEKKSTNGVIWYLLGAIIVLSLYPLDIATVSILILSWCDTAASFFGRAYGRRTPPLPSSIPLPFVSQRVPLPFAQRKSLAGFMGASATGALVAAGFWGCFAQRGELPPTWAWGAGGWVGTALGLGVVSAVTGLVAGVAEALDVGSLDDNLTLPIISGGAMWGLFKLLDWASS